MNDKKSFIVYHDMLQSFRDELTYEQLGKLWVMSSLYDSGATEEQCFNEVGLDLKLVKHFGVMCYHLDRDKAKWQDIVEKRSKAGSKHKGNQYTNKNGTNGTCVPNGTNGTNGTDNVNVNVTDNVNVNVTDNVSVSNSTRTHEEIIAEFQADNYQQWHESLAMTYRLTIDDIKQCVADGVRYCINMGIDLTRSNVMRYTKTACERYKPALKPLQDRKTAFASECKALKADANLIGEFYEYYTQPMRDNDDCMLFESFRSWNTATRFKQFLNRKQHGN